MTTEQKAIKGIIIDEVFLTNQTQTNQEYPQLRWEIIAEANSKKIPIIIRSLSVQNEFHITASLKQKGIQTVSIASDKNTFNTLLFSFRLNSSDCVHLSHERSKLYKKYKTKINYTLISSTKDFDQLLTKIQQQKTNHHFKDENFEISLISDSPSNSLSFSRDGDLGEVEESEKFYSCRSSGILGFFGGAGVGFVTGGAAEYFIWPFVKAYFPAGEASEIGIKLAFAAVIAGIGSGVGYGISKIDCSAQSEAVLEPSYKNINVV